ncbi:hypothetical protein [Limnobacter litoralis]|uniref:Uncharacterized protein n=1 Tax=Limnobacter litoralis TaxID=481366 RepID=A0ABQ5YPK9_9BURK|nr:hypothetical protein [Limnobacter litoralis]GLR25720.1 hypothetical protein GCM10007875_08080 [Limnobacter litoralis]
MRIEITRQAVCAADDQTNPLEMYFEVDQNLTIQHLVNEIEAAKFLQFSSTHQSIVGHSGGVPIIKIHSPYHSSLGPEYLVPASIIASEIIQNGRVEFKF